MTDHIDQIEVIARHVANLVEALGPGGKEFHGLRQDVSELRNEVRRVMPYFDGDNPIASRVKALEGKVDSLEKIRNWLVVAVLAAVGTAVLNLVLRQPV